MSDTMRVGLVQINSRHDKESNIARAEALIDEAASLGSQLVALPEFVDYLGPDPHLHGVPEAVPEGPTSQRFAAKARQHGIYLLGGSIHEATETPGKSYNTSVLYGPDGGVIALYRKIHLFDIDITGNVSANESSRILPGEDVVMGEIDGHQAGLTICYDLRFPELFRMHAVAGAEILFVPAAFTMFTGKDHWHTLLRARAIENQCYVLAPGQVGAHEPNDQKCYGHSVVIDPWGTVLADAPDKECVVTAEIDFDLQRKLRAQLPSLANRRPSAYRERAPIS